jgi:hypothetical protein
MPHPHHHSLSSVKRWGGVPDDYAAIHDWFDLIWTGTPFRTIPRRMWSSRWVRGAALASSWCRLRSTELGVRLHWLV